MERSGETPTFASASAMVRDVINARNSPDYLAHLEMQQLLKASPTPASPGQKPDQETILASLIKLLLMPSMVVAGALCDCLVSSSPEYESVCNSLMILFRYHRHDLRLVEWAVGKEIDSCEVGKTATLFRGMTVGAKLASIYLHMKGHFFLKGVLQPLIAQMQSASSIEVDPLKMADLSQLPDNQKRLTESVEQMFRAMESAIDLFPSALKWVFQTAQRRVEQRFHEKGYELIGGFFFLRFVCPALVSPERVGLASGVLSAETRRSLILISKVLQNASNDVQFGDKEKYMLFINEWIHNNHERMQRFLGQLCVVPADVDINAATLGKEKVVTEEEKKMAIRAVVSSFITHKEQMSVAMAGNKEQSLFDRLIQAVDPSELVVENVTLNFRESAVLSDVDSKRSADNRKKDKEKKDKKDKLQKKPAAEGKDKDGNKADKSPQTTGGAGRDDSKVMLKGRWRRLNRPPSPLGDSAPSLTTPPSAGGASSPPQVEPFLRLSKELVHQELRTNFTEGKVATLRHVSSSETTNALESQVGVLKEQLSAEREVRRKVETELNIARNQLSQESARREVLERLVQAMHDKLKAVGVPFTLPSTWNTPAPLSSASKAQQPSPQDDNSLAQPSPPANLHIPAPLPNPNAALLPLPNNTSPMGFASGSAIKAAVATPTPIRPSPIPMAALAGKFNSSLGPSPQSPGRPNSFSNNSSTSTATSTSTSPGSRGISSPQNNKPAITKLHSAGALLQSTSLTQGIGQQQRAPSPGAPGSGNSPQRVAGQPMFLAPPGIVNRPGRSGTSLIASAYQSSGRPIPQSEEGGNKSLTERLIEKMLSSDQGLRLFEKDGKRCFQGYEGVDWLVEELRVGRDKALVIADKLLSRGFFRSSISDCAPFTDDSTLYCVVERIGIDTGPYDS